MTRKEILEQFWVTAFKGLSEVIPFEKVCAKALLDERITTDTAIHYLSGSGEQHVSNLKELQTEEGRKTYRDTLDFRCAAYVDSKVLFVKNLPNNKQQEETMSENNNNGTQEEKMERTFLVQCSKEQLIALGNWMYDNGIFFCKCSDKINAEAHRFTFPEAEAKEADGTVRP